MQQLRTLLVQSPGVFLSTCSSCVPNALHVATSVIFRLLTGHNCLRALLFRFEIIDSPVCILYSSGQDMTAAHTDECPVRYNFSLHFPEYLFFTFFNTLLWNSFQNTSENIF